MKKRLTMLLSVMALVCMMGMPVSAGVSSPGSENTKPGTTNKSSTAPKTGENMVVAYAGLAAAAAAGVAVGANKKRKEA